MSETITQTPSGADQPTAGSSAAQTSAPFDVCGELPTGTTVLEASAGTGKTYTIAALAARYLAQGYAELSDLMMVTFSRMATDELRTRVRQRLVDCERALTGRLAGVPPRPDHESDPVVGLLCAGTDDLIAARHRRIRAALADFDAATIATTHEFCQTMLNGLGVLADQEPDATFTDSLSELGHEIATDCYLRRFAPLPQKPPFEFAKTDVRDAKTTDARQIALEVINHPDARLVPVMPQAGDAGTAADGAAETAASSEAIHRYGFAADVREQLHQRKQRHKLYSFDDMLTRLQSTLSDPVHGEIAADRLRNRFRVVLVDEFQDTDPVQWDILRRVFAGHSTLILIGDPKQAIYAFRGADVYCYLDAVSQASTVATLDTNWRSDAALVGAFNWLFDRVALGDQRIGVRPMRARDQKRRLLPVMHSLLPAGPPDASASNGSASAAESSTTDADDESGPQDDESGPQEDESGPQHDGRAALSQTPLAPVRIRVQPYDPEARALPRVRDLRRRIARDLVADIADLLDRRPQLDLDGHPRSVEPSDIAVLVRVNRRAEEIRDALLAANIPAVVLGASSVYASDLAQQWLTLLNALEQPRQATIRAAALTCFVGWTMHDLATADETRLNNLAAAVRRWSRLLISRGVATLLEAVTGETQLTSRLLSVTGGERRLTDLRHIGQNLHAAMSSGQLGIASLRDWLHQRIDEAQSTRMDERSRRLESDAKAVQLLTVHRSKGLEFPIVYVPDAWDRHLPREDNGQLLRLHDPAPDHTETAAQPDGPAGPDGSAGDLVLDVGGRSGPGRRDRLAASHHEDAGEDLRLAYVACTRAQVQVVTWWAPSVNTPASALQRLLFRTRQADQAEPAQLYQVTSDPLTLPPPGSGIRIEQMPQQPRMPTRNRDHIGQTALASRRFTRPLDRDWRRTSYTALTAAAAHDAGPGEQAVTNQPEPDSEDDEAPVTETGSAPPSGEAPISPMADLPTGAEFGTVVHAVLERIDPRAEDLAQSLESTAAEELARLPGQSMTADQLAAGIRPMLETPLGPLADDHQLVDFDVPDRLTELHFELPLAGGDNPGADIRLGDVAELLGDHLSADDPLAPYPAWLNQPGLAEQPLRGFLTGSIDAVLRIRSSSGQPRYLVADYKTNWLGPVEQGPLLVSAYTPERLADAMMNAHYPLQALLYSAALHRFLRWRQPAYDPHDHLAGILYLFVRGMAGADPPRSAAGVPYGVFSWRPPAPLIAELSDVLDHGRPDRTSATPKAQATS
jgi:exodeoxyribonuclease V beta subunit